MAIDKLSIDDLLIDNVPGALPPEDTLHDEPKDPQLPVHTCTLDPTKTKAHRLVVGVENTGGKYMSKQMECTASIERTRNDGIQGIDYGPHTVFSRLKRLTS